MFKLMIFAKKKQGLTRESFIFQYEKHHIQLVNDLVRDGVHRPMLSYRRNYLLREHSLSTQADNLPFDVVTEAVFESEGDFSQTMKNLAANPEAASLLNKDFDAFLDRESLRYMVVDLHEGGGEPL